jgi:fatty-acyl-CoA synthase
MTRSVSFEPLSPVAFLDRSAAVFPDRTAVRDGELTLTYAQLHDRCLRLSGALIGLDVAPGDRVAVLAGNNHVLLEAHYGVPYAGAVLVALNTRLAPAELSYIVGHAGATVLIHDPEHADTAARIAAEAPGPLRLVDSGAAYESLLDGAEPRRREHTDERGLLALNYTSGTTGRPKGVMYHHRGAYLQSLAMVTHFRLDCESRYLWTLPMFHCNGWCFTWAVTAAGGTHVCLPKFDPAASWALIGSEAVTHLCAAPTVLTGLITAPEARDPGERGLVIAVGGAPPSPTLLAASDALGISVTHLYGLTETFGPVVICDWRPEWNALSEREQSVYRARQGVGNLIACSARVVDPTGADVPRDGRTLGEIALRGNDVMLGYYRDEAATAAAVPDGWLRTGDLGVLHPDGYLELRDRAKDVIVSGGENISSVEVEVALASHPAVLEAAVVAVPDERWGERPRAWVTLREQHTATAEELREHVRGLLARFKVPDAIEFGPLPKTATGKIQKFRLRTAALSGTTADHGEDGRDDH